MLCVDVITWGIRKNAHVQAAFIMSPAAKFHGTLLFVKREISCEDISIILCKRYKQRGPYFTSITRGKKISNVVIMKLNVIFAVEWTIQPAEKELEKTQAWPGIEPCW